LGDCVTAQSPNAVGREYENQPPARRLTVEPGSQLADRARQEGIRHLTALVAADNTAVIGLLQDSLIGVSVTHRKSGAVEHEITLPPRGVGDELHALLRAFGRRQFRSPTSIRDTLASLTPDEIAGHGQGPDC
jgi:hypothetical protein